MVRGKLWGIGLVAAMAGLPAWMLVGASGELSAQTDRRDPGEACAALLQIGHPGIELTGGELIAAGPAPAPPGSAAAHLPEHCLVRGMIDRRIGAGGREFGIGFELRLPTDWNGRFLFQGGAGLDGQVTPALGTIANSGGPPALARGFAVVSTDSGHQGSMIDASFGLDQQARVDYAYNALGEVTAEAKRLLAAFYGSGAEYSYFMGCSNGGRQALVASQRLPLEFDGIVAGDPAMSFSRLALGEVWNMQVLARIAPRDEEGRPIYSRAFSDDDLRLVKESVLDRCDALDGLADGMINDWQSCDFHPRELVCSPGAEDNCLGEDQASVLDDLMQGPKTGSGRHIYGPFNYDTGIASSAWRGMRLGTSQTGEPNSADSSLGLGQFRFLQLTPPEPDWNPLSPYDLDEMLERLRHQGGMGDGDSPFLSTFVRKGKMIVYNGLSDQGMATPHIARWYEDMVAASGPDAREAVRLYAVPGMLHCGGGEATDSFEMLDAITAWVEQGEAPERIIARGDTMPGVSRPLCPYPAVARYLGGDPDQSESFVCSE
ncbi:feruloyl esterase [Altererythrobacter atlanticus]|uniref:Tannase and feruloyl esterase n=1 Tax=Croceibacterium atlanticum TaxID=1267766 RepID=A0A0F7KLH6_9SPHN|nr:tannase/feruloyl esterase family alpha/beta hydrolase [Croceibacterium atlanticum]AKH41398.1 Tannase and feruloyl esterase [Croceibacterium atlanticum]MBB5732860.1 feruloyl esterase [Croceibacterium atlanticum]